MIKNVTIHLTIICCLLLFLSKCSTKKLSQSNFQKPVNLSKAYQSIDIQNVDEALLIHLIHQKVNELRGKKKLWELKLDPFLTLAAQDHNNYIAKIQNLQHEQDSRKKRSVLDRVRMVRGQHHLLGENLQFLGFTILSKDEKLEVLPPTYEAAAEEIVDNWIDSATHYDNLIHKEFDYFGTAILYHPKQKGIYITQVYGAL